jgi:AMP nucleosidase
MARYILGMTASEPFTATDPAPILAELTARYDAACARLRADIARYIAEGILPDAQARAQGAYCYPELRLHFSGVSHGTAAGRAFGRLTRPGTYATTITRPALFGAYLVEQLGLLGADYEVTLEVGTSAQEIPFPYVVDSSLGFGTISPNELAKHFPTTDLAHIGDEIADAIDPGLDWLNGPAPLALFDGLRTDFSLARLAHYTGTNPADFQRYILFTNYHRYVDEFVDWAGRQLGQDDFVALTGAGGLTLDNATDNARDRLSDTAWRRHQMPAYHLIRPDRSGITLVNIGVGPSNAKTICDHLAVLRPEAWLMIGHCGGLRPTQKIGDYVLAHAYLRDDHVLDDVLPRKSRFRPSPKCRWRWPARLKSSAAVAARTSRPACAPVPS